jgi:transcriptional regulator with XRE-family HTH domain
MEKLKRLREKRGLSQVKLAARADLNPATVNQIERGMREASPGTLRKLADALEVSLYELMEEEAPKAYGPTLQLELEEQREASEERRDSEGVWRAEYLARTDEMLSKWEGEIEGELALAENEPARFFDWVQQIREFGNPHIMGIVSGFESTTSFRLEAVLGGAEFVGRWSGLWHRIEERVRQLDPTNKVTEEDLEQFQKWYADFQDLEEKALAVR